MSKPTVTAIPAKTLITCMYAHDEVQAILEAHMLAAAGIPPDAKHAPVPYLSVPGAAPTPTGSLRVTLEGEWPQPRAGRHTDAERAVLRHLYRAPRK